MFHFILADLRRNWIGVAILVVLIAFAAALGVAVTLQERALRLGSARAAAPFDLVIGAQGSETQLVLSSIFLQPAALPLMPSEVLAKLKADPRVEMAIPVGFGDFVAGYPIVGTTSDAIKLLGGLKQGSGFTHLNDAIVGAAVRRDIGSNFHPFHGSVGEAGEVHAETEYEVSGRLAPSGTPWDRAILVPIQAVWNAHEHQDGDSHEHEEALSSREVDESALVEPANAGLPAIIVKPKSIADAYNIRQQYRTGGTTAVFPAEVLTQLYGTLGDARRILSWISIAAQSLVAAAILMVIAVHVLQRRRQIGALRAFGAPRSVILSMVWLEVFAVLTVGLLLGFALGYATVQMISRRLGDASGVLMPVEFATADIWMFGLLMCIAGVATLIPAIIAFRQSPAQALRL